MFDSSSSTVGVRSCEHSITCLKLTHSLAHAETRWTSRVRDAREKELGWRVKENIVNTVISFIWYVRLLLRK